MFTKKKGGSKSQKPKQTQKLMKFEAIKLIEDTKHSHNNELLEMVKSEQEAEKQRKEKIKEATEEVALKKLEKKFRKEREEAQKEIERRTKEQEKLVLALAKKHEIDLDKDL